MNENFCDSFFFFFYKKNTRKTRNREKLQQREQNNSSYVQPSSRIICSTKLGDTPFQTYETPESLAALTSSWPALLPLLIKC